MSILWKFCIISKISPLLDRKLEGLNAVIGEGKKETDRLVSRIKTEIENKENGLKMRVELC